MSKDFQITPSIGRSSRRSKLEITCEILQAVSDGIEKPTQIMNKVNINWNLLLATLEALVRQQMLVRRQEAEHTVYYLTEKGRGVLDMYRKLKDHIDSVQRDALSFQQLRRISLPPHQPPDIAIITSLQSRLEAAGFKILGKSAIGRSGVKHSFDVLAETPDGSKEAFITYSNVGDLDVVSCFVKQLDADLQVTIVYIENISDKAQELAWSYSIRTLKWDQTEKSLTLLKSILASNIIKRTKIALLTVNPELSYESSVKDVCLDLLLAKYDISIFTPKVSPIHNTLSALKAKFFLMTSSVNRPTETQEENKLFIPEKDTAILLDTLERNLKGNTKGSSAIIFDSISDMILSIGLSKTYEFVKQANELIDESKGIALFVLKQGAHETSAVSFISSLFQTQIIHDEMGLNVMKYNL